MISIARRRIPTIAEESPDGRGIIDNYEYVDLKLPSGLLWATCNVGASVETDYGNYYQWGAGATQYASTNQYYTGTTNPLPVEYDTARQVMSGSWSMPTQNEFQELIDNTTYTWVTNFNGSGIKGGKFSKTIEGIERYVFFPAAGLYDDEDGLISKNTNVLVWSSTPSDSYTSAYRLSITSSSKNIRGNSRKNGYSVRGVHV